MTITFKDEWIDRIKAEGKAEQAALMLLRVLRARGFDVTPAVRDQVFACPDVDQLEAWTDRAAITGALEEIFSG